MSQSKVIVSAEYVAGIVDARQAWRAMSIEDRITDAPDILRNIESTMRNFSAGPVKDSLRGERDFWRAQIKRTGAKQ